MKTTSTLFFVIQTWMWPKRGNLLRTHTDFCTVPLVMSGVRFFNFCRQLKIVGAIVNVRILFDYLDWYLPKARHAKNSLMGVCETWQVEIDSIILIIVRAIRESKCWQIVPPRGTLVTVISGARNKRRIRIFYLLTA